MSQATGDPKAALAERFNETDISTLRFIDVHDGAKRSTDHTPREPSGVRGNYGIYPGRGLVDIDIDDYSETTDDGGLEAVLALPDTFTVETPHTDGDPGGHRYYRVTSGRDVDDFDVDDELETLAESTAEKAKTDPVALALVEAFGTPNPQPSWGEVRAVNQYVVGPGSQLDSCDKDWCDDCETPDGGRYTIATDRPIATIDAETLIEALRADPGLAERLPDEDADTYVGDSTPAVNGCEPTGAGIDDVITSDRKLAIYLAAGAKAAGFESTNGDDDRSAADWYACCTAIEHGVPEDEVRERLGGSEHSKVGAPDTARDYWRRTWRKAMNEVEASTGEADAAGSTNSQADALSKGGIIAMLDVDSEETSIGDLPNKKIAWAFDAILTESDDYEFRVLDEDTEEIYWYDTETGVWHPGGERKLKQLAQRILGQYGSRQLYREIVHQVRSNARRIIDRKTLGIDEGYLALKTDDGTGVLNLRNPGDGPQEPAPDDYILSRIDTKYDPQASIDGTRFEAYLTRSVAPEDRDKVQEYAGYCLWTAGQPFKKAMFLIGPTDSGKGTFLKTLEAILGRENVAWQRLYNLIQTRWGTSKIYGKMTNMANEVTAGSLKRVERFKELTGGEDTVTAERKGQPTFEFVVTQKFLFATNQFPRMKDAGDPFFNRCLFAEFPNSIPKEDMDPNLLDDLNAERSAILNWMLDGLHRLLEQEDFSDERSIDEKRGLTKSFGSPAEQFIYDTIDVTGNPEDVVHKGELYDAFTRYCDFIDAENTPVQGAFTRRLKEEGGVSDGQSRRVGEGDSREHVYTGLIPDIGLLRQIQAEIPDFATADETDESAGGAADSEPHQTSVVNHQ